MDEPIKDGASWRETQTRSTNRNKNDSLQTGSGFFMVSAVFYSYKVLM
jgi:hypothetical protein